MTFYDKYFIKKQIKAYIISLEEPKLLFNTLENQNITPILVESINSNNLTQDIKNKNASYFYSKFGSNNSIANGMSHIKTWKKILESKDPYGIVLEDDIVLSTDFYDKIMTYIKNLPKDYDLFYLGCFGCQNNLNSVNIICNSIGLGNFDFVKINKYINKPSISLGVHAYVISRDGIKKLLKLLEGKLYFNIDLCLQLLAKNNEINVYSPTNRLAYRELSNPNIYSNIENNTPLILNNLLSKIYIDEKCKLSYITTLSLFKYDKYNFTISSILFILFGFHLGNYNYNFYEMSLFYLILSIPDLVHIDNISIKIHYLLFITSFLISKKINSSNN